MLKNLFLKVSSSSLARTSGIYTVSGFINAAIPLALLPLLTNRLSPADYGIVAMFQIVNSLVYPFVGLNLEGSVARKYYDKDGTDFASYVGTSIILACCSFLITTGFGYLFFNTIQRNTAIPEGWIKFIFITAVFQFFVAVVLVNFQVRVKPVKYGVVQILQSVLNVGLTLLFVIVLKKTWDGRLEAQIITSIAFGVVSLIILFSSGQLKVNIKKEDIRYALSFGIPLIPHALGGMFFIAIDRFFLTRLVGLEQTGNYTVAYQIGAVISIITFAFNNAYVPWLFENLTKNDELIKRRIVRFTYLYFIVLIAGAMLLLLIFPLVVSIFVGERYNSVNTYSTFIVFGFVFQGMYYMVTNYVIYAQKTFLQAIVTLSVGLLKLPIAYFSIILFGSEGASISFCVTFMIFFLATWWLSARVYKMPWSKVLSNRNLIPSSWKK
jgi:O-antigen/teichoic acid export membrane protein